MAILQQCTYIGPKAQIYSAKVCFKQNLDKNLTAEMTNDSMLRVLQDASGLSSREVRKKLLALEAFFKLGKSTPSKYCFCLKV